MEKEIWPLLTALADQFHTHMLRHLISMGLVGGFVDVTLSPEEITRRLGCISGLKNMCVGPLWAMLDIDPLLEGARAFALVSQRLERSYAFASGEIHFLSLQDEEENTAALLDHGALLDRMDRALYRAIVVLIHFTHVFSSSFQLTIFAFICIFRYFSISWMPGKFLPFFRVLLDYTEIRGSFQGFSMYKIEHIFLCIFFFYYIAL